MSDTSIDKAIAFCHAQLMGNDRREESDLVEAARMVLSLPDGMLPEPRPSYEDLLTRLQAIYSVYADDYGILTDEETYRSWLPAKKGEIEWRFWNRYRVYLSETIRLPPDTVNRLDNLTDDILDRLADPTAGGSWDRRGMVVGQVQSGKTGNYIGLINKAADAGYRVIVILAGIHDSLRSQTQIRVDNGFLGFDTQTAIGLMRDGQRVGVGLYRPDPSGLSLTSGALNGDFKPTMPNMSLGGEQPVVMVVKKNGHILRHLVRWMGAQGDRLPDGKRLVRNAPLLVIDDEADNASINVSKDHVSRINGLVRALLALFERRAYIGYTATPFANIFIPIQKEKDYQGVNLDLGDTSFGVGQDLFPKDFIINIPPPSNYIGPARVFGLPPLEAADEEVVPLDITRTVFDYGDLIPDRHRRDAELPAMLPPSLTRAVRCFLLTCAARAARGQTLVHNSMLVHVSRFIRWQDHIATLLDRVLKTYQDRILMNDPAFIEELRLLWEAEFVPVTRAFVDGAEAEYTDPDIRVVAWADVLENLRSTAAKISVRAVHGTGARTDTFYRDVTPLDYNVEEARGGRLSVIAVGGDKLSRGLTLEGLSVSYYLRASRMYDTLMQMGRWFGYRPGYADLCRLFTSDELQEWYGHIAVASDELRREFDLMVALHRTPVEYGLKIRAHPGVLRVTAANKFKYALRMELSYSNTLAESYRLSLNPKTLADNRSAVSSLLGRLERVPPPDRIASRDDGGRHLYFSGPGSADAVCDFLRRFHVLDNVVDGDKMAGYIAAQTRADGGALRDWTVVLLNRAGSGPTASIGIGDRYETVNVTLRTQADTKTPVPDESYWIRKNHIISPEHEGLDLSADEYEQARRRTEAAIIEKRKGDPSTIPPVLRPTGEMMRLVRGPRRGLLLLYPLTKDSKATGEVEAIMGYAVSFPAIDGDIKVPYYVNEQFRSDEFDYDEEAEEAIEDA